MRSAEITRRRRRARVPATGPVCVYPDCGCPVIPGVEIGPGDVVFSIASPCPRHDADEIPGRPPYRVSVAGKGGG